jgi:hypothetical protein
MIIQFGYITLFASAYPLAFAISMFSNVLETLSDSFKLGFVMRRPMVRQAHNAGIWDKILEVQIWLAVFTNVFVFGFASDQMAVWFPSLFEGIAGGVEDTTIVEGQGRVMIALLFSIEHCVLAAGLVIMYLLSPVPQWVRDEFARQDYAKGQALRDRLQDEHARMRESMSVSASASETS